MTLSKNLVKDRFWYLSFAVLIFATFGQSLTYPLLSWDDTFHICQNPYFQSGDKNFLNLWTTDFFGLYAPVAYSVWGACVAFARAIFGSDSNCGEWSGVFHCLNLILHLANTILVFEFLKKVIKAENSIYAALGAAIFAIHPLQIEAVVWVSAGRDLLSFLFGVGGVLLVLQGRWKTATLLFLLSCLSKATGVVFPLLSMGLVVHQGRPKETLKYIPAILISVVVGVLAKSLQPDAILKFSTEFWQRPFVFAHNLGFYFFGLFLPVDLVPDYARSITSLVQDPKLFWPIGILGAVILLLVYLRKSYGLWALLWITVAILPVSGLFSYGFEETSTVADRYFYTAMVGVSFLVAHLLNNFRNLRFRNVTILALVLLSGLSFWQTRHWESDETLANNNLRVVPTSSMSHMILADIHFAKGDFVRSVSEVRKYLEMRPQNYWAIIKLAVGLENLGQVAEAEEVYTSALSKNIKSTEIFNNLGKLKFLRSELQAAEYYWKAALSENPLNFEPQFNLGQLYLNQGKFEDSLAAFVKAKSILPRHPLIDEKIQLVRTQIK
jgi:tetratricopeptide (TPR) repeat protein